MTLLQIGILAGVIQALGYVLYIKAARKKSASPNPTTWLIFSVDVFILTLLEAGAGALLEDLIVPIVCGLGACCVAFGLHKEGKLGWPEDKSDKIVLIIGILIILGYGPLWFLSEFGAVSKETRYHAAIGFLILSNLNTIVGFWPTVKNPEQEHPGSWFIWTIPYMILLGILLTRNETKLILYAYPISGVFFHGLVGIRSLKPFIKKMKAFIPERPKPLHWDTLLFRIFF